MAVVDNNVLSSLAKIERLPLLDIVLDGVTTTVSVIEELHRDSVTGYAFVNRIDEVKQHEGGWLRIVSPTDAEIQQTEEILDRSLSYTDAELIAIAAHRNERLLTDDRLVGEVAMSRAVETWDLTLFLRAACEVGAIGTSEELRIVMSDLREKDYYEFSDTDEEYLFDAW